jgi:hypothetical protein
MRPVSFFLASSILAAPASAEPLQIHGTTGYASEYELSGSVSEQDLNGKTAKLDFDGSKCTYKGIFSESCHGFMDCGGEGNIPLRLWTK